MRLIVDELRFAVRAFSRRRALAFAAIVTLGLGIGLTATMFSVVNGVVLRGLPVDSPDGLRYVERAVASDQTASPAVPVADFLELGELVCRDAHVRQGPTAKAVNLRFLQLVDYCGVPTGIRTPIAA